MLKIIPEVIIYNNLSSDEWLFVYTYIQYNAFNDFPWLSLPLIGYLIDVGKR